MRQVIFPRAAQQYYPDFSVDTTSSDGQQIQLKYTIRFAIDGKQAEWIYNNIGTMDQLVEKVVKTEARSLSRNIPKKYTAAQLYSEQGIRCAGGDREYTQTCF